MVGVEKLNERLLEKAVTALLAHHVKTTANSKDLLGDETSVQVLLGLETAPKRAHVKPIPLDIPHGFHLNRQDGDPPSVCLIVKQESKQEIKELIQKFPDKLSVVKKVIGLQSLRTNYADYSQRRKLLHSFDLFMADDRILPMLTSTLGKIFLRAKQQPIPIDLTRKSSLPFNIVRALNRTHFSFSRGTCALIVAGWTSMDAHQLVHNILSLIPQAVSKMPRKWANLRSISIKTPSSMSLPIYNKTPEELLEICKLASLEPMWSDELVPAKEDSLTTEDVSKKPAKEKSPLLQALQIKKKQEAIDIELIETDEQQSLVVAVTVSDELKKGGKRKSTDSKISNDKKQSHVLPSFETKKMTKELNCSSKSDSINVSSTAAAKALSRETSDDQSNSSFMAANKYHGSKLGYVFKKGSKGLGYYVDVKPAVDHLALDALLRMTTQKKNHCNRGSRGGQRKMSQPNQRRGGGGGGGRRK